MKFHEISTKTVAINEPLSIFPVRPADFRRGAPGVAFLGILRKRPVLSVLVGAGPVFVDKNPWDRSGKSGAAGTVVRGAHEVSLRKIHHL